MWGEGHHSACHTREEDKMNKPEKIHTNRKRQISEQQILKPYRRPWKPTKWQLTPSFKEEETEAQRSEMLVTYAKLSSDLTGPGVQPLTPSPALSTIQVNPSSPRFLLPLFKSNVLSDGASVSRRFQDSRPLWKPGPLLRAFPRSLRTRCAPCSRLFEASFLFSRLKIAPATVFASETSERGPKGMGRFITR